MSVDYRTRYPTQIDGSDPAYPYGKAVNISTTGDGTGTPWEKDLVNDWLGFFQSLLQGAGITPSGVPDKVGVSQYLDALKKVLQPRIITTKALSPTPVQMSTTSASIVDFTGADLSFSCQTGDVLIVSGHTMLKTTGGSAGALIRLFDGTSYNDDVSSGIATGSASSVAVPFNRRVVAAMNGTHNVRIGLFVSGGNTATIGEGNATQLVVMQIRP